MDQGISLKVMVNPSRSAIHWMVSTSNPIAVRVLFWRVMAVAREVVAVDSYDVFFFLAWFSEDDQGCDEECADDKCGYKCGEDLCIHCFDFGGQIYNLIDHFGVVSSDVI